MKLTAKVRPQKKIFSAIWNWQLRKKFSKIFIPPYALTFFFTCSFLRPASLCLVQLSEKRLVQFLRKFEISSRISFFFGFWISKNRVFKTTVLLDIFPHFSKKSEFSCREDEIRSLCGYHYFSQSKLISNTVFFNHGSPHESDKQQQKIRAFSKNVKKQQGFPSIFDSRFFVHNKSWPNPPPPRPRNVPNLFCVLPRTLDGGEGGKKTIFGPWKILVSCHCEIPNWRHL